MGHDRVEVHHHQVLDLERELVTVTEAGVQHELEGEASTAIGGHTLHQVFVVEPSGVRWLTGQAWVRFHRLRDERGQAALVVRHLLESRVQRGPHTDFIAAFGEPVVQGHLTLRCAQVDDACRLERLEDRIEFLHGLGQLVPHHLRGRVVRDFDVVRNDDVSTGTSDLAHDAHGLNRGGLVRQRWSNLKRYHLVDLIGPRLEVLEQRHFVDEALNEGGERIGTGAGRGHYQDAELGVSPQEPAHECGCDP